MRGSTPSLRARAACRHQLGGEARAAALDRADADVVRARAPVWALRDPVGIARTGAGDLYAIKQRTVSAIDNARAAGFEVREDLAVNAYVPGRPPVEAMALQPRANELAAEIRAHAADLAELDQKVAAKITAAAERVRDVSFAEAPVEQAVVYGAMPAPDIPRGIIVLCSPGPRGGPWAFDCSVLYPSGVVDSYPSDDDESGGYP